MHWNMEERKKPSPEPTPEGWAWAKQTKARMDAQQQKRVAEAEAERRATMVQLFGPDWETRYNSSEEEERTMRIEAARARLKITRAAEAQKKAEQEGKS
jgi:hypothetical protein